MAKPDLYTKAVLTVIALCLLVLVADKVNFIPLAVARTPTGQPSTPRAAYGLVPVNPDGSITVKLQADEVVDVRLRGIDQYPTFRWETIKVTVEE